LKALKVVLIGAGSATFGSGAIVDLMAAPELREFDLTIALVDIDQAGLDRMSRWSRLLKEHFRSPARIEATTDRTEVLPGADYVVTSVAQHRWELWEKDYYIPLAYGFRQVMGENGGPGAAFHTLRSLHLMMPICRDMERLCPDALLLNFTNPESRVCLGVSRLTRLRNVGLCHGPMETLQRIAEILDKPAGEIELTVAGLNHFHWALEVRDRASGADLRPELDRRIEQADWDIDTLTPLLHELFGFMTYPAPSHPGEYLQFGHEIAGAQLIQWGIGGVSRKLSAKAGDQEYVIEGRSGQFSYHLWSLEVVERMGRILAGKEPLSEEFTRTSNELMVPIICGIELDGKRRELAANVLNRGKAIENLPEDAVVELPIWVDAEGVHPVRVGALPEALAGLCSLQVSIQKLLVEAYRQGSKQLLLQAIMLEPAVDSYRRAKEMMEMMLKVEADALPELR
jgi:alpha-galactosidase